MECFIDGALSVANHMARDDDTVRDAIKVQLNTYFGTPFTDVTGAPLHYPQVPKYGFFLRSAVISIFPNLVLDVPFADPTLQNGRVPILLKKHLGKDVLLVLLDRAPEELKTIKMSQPPHQQRFSAGDLLDDNSLEFLFRRMYRSQVEADFFHEFGGPQKLYRPGYAPPASTGDHASMTVITQKVYDWNTRCLNMKVLEDFLLGQPNGLFVTHMPAEWGGTGPQWQLSSAMAGLLLVDTMKYIEIKGPNYDNPKSTAQVPYKMRVNPLAVQAAQVSSKLSILNKANLSTSAPLGALSLPGTATGLPPTMQNLLTQPPNTSARVQAQLSVSTPAHLAIRTSALSQPNPFHLTPPNSAITTITMKEPGFEYAIYPSTCSYVVPPLNSAPFANSWIPVDTPYAQDLIFSINIKPAWANPNTKGSLWLSEVQFTIPIGNPARRKGNKDIQGLGLVPDNASAGLRGRMLTNQRWIVHLDPGSEYMIIRLIPRSTRLATPVEWNRSLSFKLDEVDVGGLNVGTQSQTPQSQRGLTSVDVKEIYGWYNEAGKFQPQGTAEFRMSFLKVIGFPDWRPGMPMRKG